MATGDSVPFEGVRLLGVVLVELIGVSVVGVGLVELYFLHGNPVRSTTLIPLGSLIMAFGSMWFAKIYSGPRLFGYIHGDGVQGSAEDWARVAVFGTVLLLALVGLVALVAFLF